MKYVLLSPVPLKSYLRKLFLCTFLVTFLPIVTAIICLRSDNTAMSALVDYKTNNINQNNDVVFIGDSSCLSGVIPKIIEEEVGIKTINLATLGAYGMIGYEIILRRYLQFNRPPRLVIYYISPSIPNIYSVKNFEKIMAYVKYPSLDLFIDNFGEYNVFHVISAFNTYISTKISFMLRGGDNREQLLKELEESRGFQKNSSSGLGKDVKFNSRYTYGDYFNTPNDPRKKITRLLSHFDPSKTKIVIYIAPMTENEEAYEYFKDIYKELAANTPYKLPNNFFADYTHLTYEGAVENSKIVALFLKKALLNLESTR